MKAEKYGFSLPNWRIMTALLVVFVLAVRPVLGVTLSAGLLRLIVLALGEFGADVSMGEHRIVAGSLEVPWSDDCAGVAYFVILPLVACWSYLRVAGRTILWHLIGLPLLLAAGVNLLRVISIMLCRWFLWPDVESPQVHFFLGFIWLLPALWWVLSPMLRVTSWLPALLFASVLALLTPQIQAPGGSLIALSSICVLASRLTSKSVQQAWSWAHLIWIIAAVCISVAQMESLWLPWLLVCPIFQLHQMPRASWLLLLATSPLVAMHQPMAWLIFGPLCGFVLYSLKYRADEDESKPASMRTQIANACCLLVPFASLSLDVRSVQAMEKPVPSLKPEIVAAGQYELHLSRQPAGLRVDWISPMLGGRHHTLQVCMAYRGEYLRRVEGVIGVWTDGHLWRLESFLHEGESLESYPDYLWHSLMPGSSVGTHLIFSAKCEAMTAADFESAARDLARRIHEHQRSSTAHQPS